VANASACCWPRPDPEPQLLVLDEPMSALDEAGIQVFEQLLHGWRQAGTTVLWIEHDLKPLRLADRVTGLNRQVLFDAPPAQALTPERLLGLFSVHPAARAVLMSFEAFRQLVQEWAGAGYLPEALAYGFVVNALLAGLMIGPVLGGLGTLVVVKRFAFFSEAVGHAGADRRGHRHPAGRTLHRPLWQPVRLLPAVRHPAQLPAQPHRAVAGHLIGVFLSVSLALGASLLLMLAGKINVHILENVLFGSVLTVSGQDLLVLGIVALLVLAWRCRCTTASCWPASTRSWRRCAGGGEDPGLPVRGAGDAGHRGLGEGDRGDPGRCAAGDPGGGRAPGQPVAQGLFLRLGADCHRQHPARHPAADRPRPAGAVGRRDHPGRRHLLRPRRLARALVPRLQGNPA
jgi:hypothetical protein